MAIVPRRPDGGAEAAGAVEPAAVVQPVAQEAAEVPAFPADIPPRDRIEPRAPGHRKQESEATLRRYSFTAEGRERAAIVRPRISQRGVPKGPLQPLENGDEAAASRAPLFPSRGLPKSYPNVKVPGQPPGGNVALRPEDMGSVPRDPSKPPIPVPAVPHIIVDGRRRATKEEAARIRAFKRNAPDPRTALSDWVGFGSPRDEFVRSLENWGKGVTITEIARRWNLPYARALQWMRDERWQEERERYQRDLRHHTERTTIQKIADEQAKLEANAVAIANVQLARLARRLKKKEETQEEFDVRDDLAATRALDMINRVLRRNSGLPETSHEIRSRAEFVHELLEKVGHIFLKFVHDPSVIRPMADELERLGKAFGLGVAEDQQHRMLEVEGSG